MKKRAGVFLMGLILGAAGLLSAEIPDHPLVEMTRQKRGPRLDYALENHAKISLTPDGKTFYLWWVPEGSTPGNPPPVIANISGHDGLAVEDFHVWHAFLQKRGYRFLAIQWWLGSGEGPQDYLTPSEIYRVMEGVFQKENVKPGTVLLHGFSRGSTNTYTVAALDRSGHQNYFALIIANAGKANSNYPPVHEIETGRYGAAPLEGTHWVTFAGGRDPNPERDGIQGMRDTGRWIAQYGGTVDLAIEDPDAGHGGFHRNPQNTEAALNVFEKRLSRVTDPQ